MDNKNPNQENLLINDKEESSSNTQIHPQENSFNDERSQFGKHNSSKPKNYRQFPYRFVVLIFFFFGILINGIAYETCIPIAKEINSIYGVSSSIISLTATIFMLMHPIFTFFASQIIIAKGFAMAVKLGMVVTICGLAVRLLVNTNFYFVLFGQILCGIGRPMILNGQATMAQNWFFPSKRTAVLTAANMVQTLSIVISLQIPGTFVFHGYKLANDDSDYTKGRQLTFKLMYYELILAAILIPGIFLMKNCPKTPPSGFANTDVKVPFGEAVKTLFKNKDFVLSMIPFSLYFGILKGFSVVTPYLLEPFGYNSSQIAIQGSMPLAGGILSSFGISTVVKRVRKYKLISIVLMIASLIICLLFYPALLTNKIALCYLVGFMVGFCLVPMIPVMMELCCEIIYPLNGSFAVGILYSGSTLTTVVSSQLLTIITKGTNSDKWSCLYGIIFIAVLLLVGVVMFSFVKEVQNRTKEILQRTMFKSTLFFKSTILQRSQVHGRFKVSSILQSIGDYPTYYPFGDQKQFLQNPEVFDPDNVGQYEQQQEEDQQQQNTK